MATGARRTPFLRSIGIGLWITSLLVAVGAVLVPRVVVAAMFVRRMAVFTVAVFAVAVAAVLVAMMVVMAVAPVPGLRRFFPVLRPAEGLPDRDAQQVGKGQLPGARPVADLIDAHGRAGAKAGSQRREDGGARGGHQLGFHVAAIDGNALQQLRGGRRRHRDDAVGAGDGAASDADVGGIGPLPAPEDFRNIEGKGVQGIVEGQSVLVGRESLLANASQHLSPEVAEAKAQAENEGKTVVAVGWGGRARGLLVVADTVKPTSAEAIRGLKALGGLLDQDLATEVVS